MLKKIFLTTLLSLIVFSADNSYADESPKYNNAFFYKNYKGNNQSLLNLADKFANSDNYQEVANGRDIYNAILGNWVERFTISERKLAQKKIKEVFFWDCDFDVVCKPIPQKLDASLKGIRFEKPFYDIEKWGITQHQLENLDFSIMLGITKPEYRYKKLITEARKGDIAAMIIAASFFQSSGLVINGTDLQTEYLKTAADLGNPYAMGQYAFIAQSSHQVPALERERYMRNAADLGDPDTLVRLSVKSKNKNDKLQFLLKAAEKNSVPAYSNLGHFYSDDGDYDAAFKWYKKAFDNKESFILPDLIYLFQDTSGLFGDKQKQNWVFKIESVDPTIKAFRLLDAKTMNVYTEEEKLQTLKDLINLAGIGGYGSVLAAQRLSAWIFTDVKCVPKSDMAYNCFKEIN